MSFLSGAFLFGLLAVAAPVVIHLIHRQHYPERRFTTLRFFNRTIKHNVLQNRLIDRLLLALRVLALIALAFGLARPFWKNSFGEKRLSLVIVLDNSPSMARLRDGKSLFHHAQAAAQSALAQLGPNDRAELLLTAPLAAPTLFPDRAALDRSLAQRAGQPLGLWVGGAQGAALSVPGLTTNHTTLRAALARVPADAHVGLVTFGPDTAPRLDYDLARVKAALAQAKLSPLAGHAPDALARAAQLLHQSHDGDRKLLLLSDLQKSEWAAASLPRPLGGGEGRGEGAALVSPNAPDLHGLSLITIPFEPARAPGANLAIQDCAAERREAGFGQTINGFATIRNHSVQPSDNATLSVTAGPRSRAVEVKLPPIPANSALRVDFPITITGRDRNLLCTARLTSATDPFPHDDTWHFQVAVRPPLTVLCVNGTPAAAASDRETFFLVNALAPRAAAVAETDTDVRECDLAELKDRQLFQYAVIILAGVPTLDAELRDKLAKFVDDGGGLLVFPGAKTTPEEYNGWKFLPARVTARKTGSFSYVQSLDDTTPELLEVRDRVGSGLFALSASTRLTLEPAATARPLARFADGSPALVEAASGKGRVIFAAAGAHAGDSDWPIRPAFVILVRGLVKSLGAPSTPPTLAPERLAGSGASAPIPVEFTGATPAVFRQRAEKSGPAYDPLFWFANARSVQLPAAPDAGHYLLTTVPGAGPGLLREPALGAAVTPVSLNHSPAESALAPLTAADLTRLLPKAEITFTPTVPAQLHTGTELWRWLLFAALLFLVVESLLAWRSASESSERGK
ncbi:MAG: hypothetical protein RL514_2971 [Verrucomicrobiota bacterium]|jgi:hypothetical protein